MFKSRNEIQNYVREGKINDDSNIFEYILSQKTTYDSFNKHVIQMDKSKLKYVPLYRRENRNLLSETNYFENPDSIIY